MSDEDYVLDCLSTLHFKWAQKFPAVSINGHPHLYMNRDQMTDRNFDSIT